MKLPIKVIVLILFAPVLATAATEDDYNRAWCAKQNGSLIPKVNYEVPIRAGRIDCLTKTHAIEMDYAKNFKYCYGQATWYEQETGKMGACAFIVTDVNRDMKYIEYFKEMLHRDKKYMEIYIITPAVFQ